MERRKFIADAGLATAAGLVSMSSTQPNRMTEKNIFIHHVYFWLKNAGNNEDRDKLVEGLRKLSRIDYIKLHHIGVPADTNRDVVERGYAVSWLLFFKNAADQERYQTDPIHLEFVKECSSLWEKVVVYDTVDA